MTDPICYAGLDVSMEETHLCVIDEDGAIRTEGKVASTPDAIARALAATPGLTRAVFETGCMAPMLFHGLRERGMPVVCIESRQAHHTLKAIKANKSDQNDARGLAQLARTGFYKPTHVKSLSAHAVRALLAARKKLVGQRVTLENQIRGLAVVFEARLPRSLTPAFKAQALELAQGVPGLATAMRGLLDARGAVLDAIAAIDRDVRAMAKASEACRLLTTVPGVGPITALAFAAAIDDPARFRRSREVGAYLGLTPRRYQSGETDLQWLDHQTGRHKAEDAALRGRQRPADAHQGRVRSQDLGARRGRTLLRAQGPRCPGTPPCGDHACDAA